MLFCAFPYDYPLLWTSNPTPPEIFDQVEAHLKFLHASPPIIPRILHIIIGIGFSGFFIKLYKPSEANLLFDGASLGLYLIGVIIYVTNIIKGLRIVSAGLWEEILLEGARHVQQQDADGMVGVGREDSLRVLAASNTILALVLVGVLVLQAGQWYAERKDRDDSVKYEREQKEKVAAAAAAGTSQKSGHVTRSSSKKKQ